MATIDPDAYPTAREKTGYFPTELIWAFKLPFLHHFLEVSTAVAKGPLSKGTSASFGYERGVLINGEASL